VKGKSTWTNGCELNNGLLFSKKQLKPLIYDENDESGSSLKRRKNDSYNKIEVIDNNGENIDLDQKKFLKN